MINCNFKTTTVPAGGTVSPNPYRKYLAIVAAGDATILFSGNTASFVLKAGMHEFAMSPSNGFTVQGAAATVIEGE